jgi:hypothetical protein
MPKNALQRKFRPERSEAPGARSPAASAVEAPKEQAQVAVPPAEELYELIRETAYFKAEARNFAPGVELQDWLEAEKEVRMRFEAS